MNELASEGKEFVFVISYDMQHSYIEEVGSVNDQEMLYAFPHINNLPEGESPAATPVRWTFDAPDRAKYERSINHVKQNQCEAELLSGQSDVPCARGNQSHHA